VHLSRNVSGLTALRGTLSIAWRNALPGQKRAWIGAQRAGMSMLTEGQCADARDFAMGAAA
jgi:hypothetical protein